MRIALIRKRYTPYGGAEVFVEHLAEALSARGYEVHILAQAWDPPDKRLPATLTVHRIPASSGPYWWQALGFARQVKHRVEASSFDLVHSFERTYSQDIYRAGDGCHREFLRQRSRYASRVKRASFKTNPNHWVTLWLERQTFTRNPEQVVIANSRRGQAEILNHFSVPEKNIRVIYNALPAWPKRFVPPRQARKEKLRHLNLDPADPWLLFLGSGFERKGLPLVLKGLAEIGDERVKLLVVGRDRPAPYQEQVRKMGLENRVFFLGPQTETAPFYQAADVFVLPSYYEPFSNACLEALSFGLPVVTSEMNGVAEILQPERNGFILKDLASAVPLAEAVRQALAGDREHLFYSNKDQYGWDFSLDGRIREFQGCYRETLDRKRKKPDAG